MSETKGVVKRLKARKNQGSENSGDVESWTYADATS
jgi:hypothetical protein